jgi:tRNA threonylcarbamoyladenosine biosynthesis protein TsaB
MLLLSAETSGRHGSIALARTDSADACEVIEVAFLDRGNFSEQLIPQIAALLTKHSFTKNNIDAFVVASGPGSFTGLRVGLAAIKALAEILAKPIAAVSLLEALAVAGGMQGRVIAALDAGRGDVYAGEYEIANNAATLIHEQVQTKEGILAMARESTSTAFIVTSERSLAEAMKEASIPVTLVEILHAGSIAALGWRKIQVGTVVSPENLEANYIRRSDAEILHKMKENTGH